MLKIELHENCAKLLIPEKCGKCEKLNFMKIVQNCEFLKSVENVKN